MSAVDLVFRTVLHVSVGAVPLLAAVVLLRWAGRRWVPPGIIFALWVLAAGVLLVPWRVPLPAGWGGKVVAWFSPPRPAAASLSPAAGRQGASIARIAASKGDDFSQAPPEMTRISDTIRVAHRWWEAARNVWLGGLLLLVGLRVAAVIGFRRRLGRSARAGDPRWERVVERCGRELGIPRLPRIVTTSLVGGPALHGLWRPCLLVPPGLVGRLEGEELAWVARHELAHLQRRDLWSHLALQMAVAVHWFNPLAWLAAHLARQDGELACDARVLRAAHPAAVEGYGLTLLKILGLRGDDRRLPAAVGIIEGRRHLGLRIRHIAGHRRAGGARKLTGLALVAGFALAGYTREQTTPEPAAPPASDFAALPARRPPAMAPEVRAARERATRDRRAWEEKAVFALRAVGSVGGVPVALLDVDGEPHFVVEGNALAGRQVEDIDAGKSEIALRRLNGTGLDVLAIREPRPVEFPQLDAAWIERLIEKDYSKDYREATLPANVLLEWSRINRDAKEAILLNYLKTGWVLNVYEGPAGTNLGMGATPLFARQIGAGRVERMNRFLASLTPEQRGAFHEGRMPVYNFTLTKEAGAAQAAAIAKIKADQLRIVASLTPEQRKLYDAWVPQGLYPSSR